MAEETKISGKDTAFETDVYPLSTLLTLTWPACHGNSVSLQKGSPMRYQCHTGHGFTANSLLSGVSQPVKDSEWNAIRALEEVIMLLEQAGSGGYNRTIDAYRIRINQA